MITAIPHAIPFTIGDCLFDSISFALSVDDVHISASELREYVARKAIAPACSDARAFWARMQRDGDEETQHHFRFASDDLDTLYNNMLDSDLYWGDDFALQRLSDRFSCRILVLQKKRRTSVSVTNPTHPKSATTLLLLLLHNSHYEPLELCDSFVQHI